MTSASGGGHADKVVLTFGTNQVDLPDQLLVSKDATTVTFSTRSGVTRTVPLSEVVAVVDAERAELLDVESAKHRAAIRLQEAREREQREREDTNAERTLRLNLGYTLREHGVGREMERRPFDALTDRGIAREVHPGVFTLATVEGDFVPVSTDDQGLRLWVLADPVVGSGTFDLLGWRGGHLPVVGRFFGVGGEALVSTVRGRWAMPDAGTRLNWAERAVLGDQAVSSRLLRRLSRGATIVPRDSGEMRALERLVGEGASVEIEPRVFVAPQKGRDAPDHENRASHFQIYL